MQALPLPFFPGAAPSAVELSLNDSSLLESLVRDHFQLVWRTLRRFGLTEADADDGAQEVFLVAHKKLSLIEAGKERAFLVSVARRVASTRRRTLSRRKEEGGVELEERATPDRSPEEMSSLRQAREQLELIFERMPDEVREVFVLFELERFTASEIARMLDCPEGTVSTRLRKGRGIFRAAAAQLKMTGGTHE